MRVLVVGGTLFMGLAAVHRLVEQGHTVTVFHRGSRCELVPSEVAHVHGDSRELTKYRSEIASFSPDAVLDMALNKGSDAGELVRALDGLTERLLAISSANVYRSYGLLHGWESADEPYLDADSESGPLRTFHIPDDMEHDEKIDVEREVMGAKHLKTTVLRLPAVHGRNDPLHRGYEYLWKMDAGRPHIVMNDVSGAWRWSRGYVDNMVDAFLLTLENDSSAGHIFNVCDPTAMTQAEWVTAIGEAAGWSGEVITAPAAPTSSDSDYRHHFVMDSTAIRRDLGYRESVETAEWIRRTVAWLRSSPPDPERREAIRSTGLSFEEEDRIAEEYHRSR